MRKLCLFFVVLCSALAGCGSCSSSVTDSDVGLSATPSITDSGSPAPTSSIPLPVVTGTESGGENSELESNYGLYSKDGVLLMSMDDIKRSRDSGIVNGSILHFGEKGISGVLRLDSSIDGLILESDSILGVEMESDSVSELSLSGCTALEYFYCNGFADGIQSYAFHGCSGLKELELGDYTEIGRGSFEGCTSLTDLVISDKCAIVGDGAFLNCSQLCNVVGTGIIKANKDSFEGTLWLQNNDEPFLLLGGVLLDGTNAEGDIVLPDCVLVGDGCFAYNNRITKVSIPVGVKELGIMAFFSCENLVSVNFTSDTTRLGGSCFRWCKNLSSVTEHRFIEYIGDSCFEGTSFLTSKCKAFSDTTGSCTVTINDIIIALDESITSGDDLTLLGVGKTADYLLQEMEFNNITVSQSSENFGTLLFDTRSKNLTVLGEYEGVDQSAFQHIKTDNLVFDCSISSFPDYLFYASTVGNIELPNNLERLGVSTFQGVSGLKKLVFPSSLKYIPSYCVVDCFDLEYVEFNGDNLVIDTCTLIANPSLREVVVNDGVAEVGNSAFRDNYNLEIVRITSDTVHLDSLAFFGIPNLKYLYLPKSLEGVYEPNLGGLSVQIMYE